MASTGAATATLSVDGVAAMSDAELGQFMTQYRRPDGGYELPVCGWDMLSKDERNRLAERLKAQERALAQSPTACSRPLDLEHLDARLRQVSSDNNGSLQLGPRPIDSPELHTPPFDPEAFKRTQEIRTYQELTSDGGRPVYPIDLLEDVLTDPSKYTDILRPWQGHPDNTFPEGIFMRQLQSWQDFRKWQTDNRGRDDDDNDFPTYVRRWKRICKRDLRAGAYIEWLAEVEADPSCLKSDWDQMQLLRKRQRRLYREHGCDSFHGYAEAVKRRLTRHGFVRPIQLHEDPKKQDQLTTWIEYLNYEYWWFDKHTSDIERLEPDHDKAWQELVDLKILRPHETKEFVRTIASPMERQTEDDNALKAVKRAELEAKRTYNLTQEDPQRLRIPRAKRISMMKESTEKLLAAKRQREKTRDRNDRMGEFIRWTFDYADAKREAARHRTLVQWVLEQIPLIEAEMAESRAKQAKPGQIKKTKRRLPTDEAPLEKPNPKKPKLDLQDSSPSTSSSAAVSLKARDTQLDLSIVTDQETDQRLQTNNFTRRSPPSVDNAWDVSQGPRRSARIAARREASQTAIKAKSEASTNFKTSSASRGHSSFSGSEERIAER
ncbi:unnamed protein product [Clonostachys rhizophaga]|uniref:Uncharacterized protein n=1 Tax=Clonostachys rhizophaga TaxID=160324 RepID=A0A9N9YHS3_9HYPO|nr:unnamed protein product [Clonostachys rhizophaga]